MAPRWLALAVVLGSLLATFGWATALGAADCSFQQGFKTLHDLIPGIVGDCLEDEHHNAQNGDGLQATTRGLLVWRKADNWTAFTDGSTTWLNGPEGLVSRPNAGPPFPWEVATVTPTSSGIEGQVTISPVRPGPVRIGESDSAPFQATVDVLNRQGGIVQTFQSNPDGTFRVGLPPGTYTIHPRSSGLPRAEDQSVTVPTGGYAQVDIRYDSGIR